jgi:hypothetical protein
MYGTSNVKLIIPLLLKKSSILWNTKVHTLTRNSSLFWATSKPSTASHIRLGLQGTIFLSFPHVSIFSPILFTCPAHFNLIDFIIIIIFDGAQDMKLLIRQFPTASCYFLLLHSNILISNLSAKNLRYVFLDCEILNFTPIHSNSKTIIMHVINPWVFKGKTGRQKSLNWLVTSISWI